MSAAAVFAGNALRSGLFDPGWGGDVHEVIVCCTGIGLGTVLLRLGVEVRLGVG